MISDIDPARHPSNVLSLQQEKDNPHQNNIVYYGEPNIKYPGFLLWVRTYVILFAASVYNICFTNQLPVPSFVIRWQNQFLN